MMNNSHNASNFHNDTVGNKGHFEAVDTDLTGAEFAEYIIYTYVIPGIVFFGIVGNLLNLIVLTNKSMSKSMERMETCAHIGLVALAVSDLLYCISVLPNSLLASDTRGFKIYPRISFSLLYDGYGDALINIFGMSSTWLTVTMAISRYLAICHPFKARILIGKTFTKASISSVFVLSFIFNIPRFLQHSIANHVYNGTSTYFLGYGPMHQSESMRNAVYMWCYFVLCIFIPFTILAFSNIFLIRELKMAPMRIEKHTSNNHNKPDNAKLQLLTLTLTLIVVFYIVFVTPAEVNKFINYLIEMKTASYNLVVAITNTMETVNFAFNFVLYCAINSHFRRVMREVLCTKPLCCKKSNATNRRNSADITLNTYSRSVQHTLLDKD